MYMKVYATLLSHVGLLISVACSCPKEFFKRALKKPTPSQCCVDENGEDWGN